MKYVIQDTTLTAIGDAIREKGGTTDLIPVVDLADAITNLPSGGGGEPLEQKYQITEGSTTFKNGKMAWLMDDYFRDSIELNIVDGLCDYMFSYATLTDEQWANVARAKNLAPAVYTEYMFEHSNVKKPPLTGFKLTGGYQPKLRYMFAECHQLEEIDDELGAIMAAGFVEGNKQGITNTHMMGMFGGCSKLKYISPIFLKSWTGMRFARDYDTTFTSCYSLRKLEGLGVTVAPYFNSPFTYISMLSKLTFDVQEDGSPYVVTNSAWGGVTISLAGCGYWNSTYYNPSPVEEYSIDVNYKLSNLKKTGTNSMLFNYDTTTDFTDGTTIFSLSEAEISNGSGAYDELLENWWYGDYRYSRYGARELAETLLSLPDISSVGSTSTISIRGNQASCVKVLKQKGNAQGIMNTVSDVATNYPDAVAAATAKGWTLSFT